MKNNLKLIARGALLGYAIAMAFFCVFSLFNVWLFEIFLYMSFYGMGLGIVTELSFSEKSFMEKLSFYLVGIFFCPPVFCLILFGIFNYLPFQLIESKILEFMLFFFIGFLSVLGILYLKKANFLQVFSYLVGYVSVFIAFAISFFLALNFQLGLRGDIESLVVFALIFIAATTSVFFAKFLIFKIRNFEEREKENL